MKLKILFFLLLSGLAWFYPSSFTTAAGTKPFGTQCTGERFWGIGLPSGISGDDECESGDCEESNQKDSSGENKWFCDCDDDDSDDDDDTTTSEDCTREYQGQPSDGGNWRCVDGSDISWQLDFCQSTNNTVIRYPLLPTNDIKGDLTGRLFNPIATVNVLSGKLSDDINDNFAIKLPGLKFTKLEQTLDAEGYIYIPWLGEYIRALYNFGLAIASIVAVIIIIFQGARVITSGGGEGKQEGLKKIGHVAVGLVIAWSSYAILYSVNPDLVQFKSLKVKFIQSAPLPPIDNGLGAEDSNELPVAIDVSGMAKLSTVSGLRLPNDGKERYARPELISDLQLAIADYNHSQGDQSNKANINLNSALRTGEEQYDLMDRRCGCPPTAELEPTMTKAQIKDRCSEIRPDGTRVTCNGCTAACSVARDNGVFTLPPIGHYIGNALDMNVGQGSNFSCDKANSNELLSKGAMPDVCIPQRQQQLIKAMIAHNFCVGLKDKSVPRESWHFEYKGDGKKVSKFCTDDKNDPNLQKLYWVQN